MPHRRSCFIAAGTGGGRHRVRHAESAAGLDSRHNAQAHRGQASRPSRHGHAHSLASLRSQDFVRAAQRGLAAFDSGLAGTGCLCLCLKLALCLPTSQCSLLVAAGWALTRCRSCHPSPRPRGLAAGSHALHAQNELITTSTSQLAVSRQQNVNWCMWAVQPASAWGTGPSWPLRVKHSLPVSRQHTNRLWAKACMLPLLT